MQTRRAVHHAEQSLPNECQSQSGGHGVGTPPGPSRSGARRRPAFALAQPTRGRRTRRRPHTVPARQPSSFDLVPTPGV